MERHLRRDQRWRYEHLSVEDPVTKTIRHNVRDKKGKLLTPHELELEYPKFKDVALVDIGEKLPFYDEAMAGNTHMTSSSENRVRVQILSWDTSFLTLVTLCLCAACGGTLESSSTTKPCSLTSTGVL